MAKKSTAGAEPERVRLQVTLCRSLAADLARHASELDRSQAWLSAWALRITLDDPVAFTQWMLKRLKKPTAYQKWQPTEEGNEIRLQIRVEPDTAKRLELAAIALNQSPFKLAGLMIDHALEDSEFALKILKTWPGKWLRELVRGKEDLRSHDLDDSAEPERGNDDE